MLHGAHISHWITLSLEAGTYFYKSSPQFLFNRSNRLKKQFKIVAFCKKKCTSGYKPLYLSVCSHQVHILAEFGERRSVIWIGLPAFLHDLIPGTTQQLQSNIKAVHKREYYVIAAMLEKDQLILNNSLASSVSSTNMAATSLSFESLGTDCKGCIKHFTN